MQLQSSWVLALAVASSSLLGACSISFVAARVHRVELGQDLTQVGGIYYALPKTVIDIEFPVEVTTFAGGELEAVPGCRLDYDFGRKVDPCQTLSKAAEKSIRSAVIASRPVVDYEHVYRVSPDSSMFKTIQFEFEYDALGNLVKSDSAGQDDTFKVLTTVAGAVASYGFAAAPVKAFDAPASVSAALQKGLLGRLVDSQASAPSGTSATKSASGGRESDNCGRFSDRRIAGAIWETQVAYRGYALENELKVKRPLALTRTEVECLTDLVNPRTQPPASYFRTANDLEQSGGLSTPGVAAVWIAQRAKEREEKQEMLKAARVALRMEAATKSTALYTVRLAVPLIPAPLPTSAASAASHKSEADKPTQRGGVANHEQLCEPVTFTRDLFPGRVNSPSDWCVLTDKALAVQGPDLAGVDLKTVISDAFLRGTRYLVRVIAPDAATGFPASAPAPGNQARGGGYRYRIPAVGRVEFAKLNVGEPPECGTSPDSPGGPDCSAAKRIDCPQPNDAKACVATLMGGKSLVIAQLGLLAVLPETFKGTGAQLSFGLTDTGALKNIKLGQKAQTGAEVAGLLGTVREARAKREQEQDAADSAAAEAPAKARKAEIQERKDALCLSALNDPALVQGTLPAVCE